MCLMKTLIFVDRSPLKCDSLFSNCGSTLFEFIKKPFGTEFIWIWIV